MVQVMAAATKRLDPQNNYVTQTRSGNNFHHYSSDKSFNVKYLKNGVMMLDSADVGEKACMNIRLAVGNMVFDVGCLDLCHRISTANASTL